METQDGTVHVKDKRHQGNINLAREQGSPSRATADRTQCVCLVRTNVGGQCGEFLWRQRGSPRIGNMILQWDLTEFWHLDSLVVGPCSAASRILVPRELVACC